MHLPWPSFFALAVWLWAAVPLFTLAADTGFEAGRSHLELGGTRSLWFGGSLLKELRQNNRDALPLTSGTADETAVYFLARTPQAEPRFSARPGVEGRYEYGLSDNWGIGLALSATAFRAHGYSVLSRKSLVLNAGYLAGWDFSTLNLYARDINRLYVFYRRPQNVFEPRLAELELAYHFRPGEALDPYVRIVAGGGDDTVYGSRVTSYGAHAGARWFFTSNLYVYGHLGLRAMDVRRTDNGDPLWKTPPNGQLRDLRIAAGVGVSFGRLPGFSGLTRAEVEVYRATIRKLKRIRRVRVGVRRGKLAVIVLDHALFPSGSAKMYRRGAAGLREVSRVLSGLRDVSFRVEGHTDSRKPSRRARYRSNRALSRARARAAMRIMRSEGIAGSRLSSIGFGASRPVRSNRTRAGRRANRRVEIVANRDLSGVPELITLIKRRRR